ncbi:MAG TPA: hypothetical protein VFD58_25660 [Blastocatellia bacterium]|nr:hypothetical protein [Blastocatellia bacterium]
MADEKKTGSQKMNAARATGGFSPQELKSLVASLRRLKLKPDVIINGTPRPDLIRGSFTAPSPGAAQEGVGLVLGIRDAIHKPLRLFPKGTPLPDNIRVEFEAKAANKVKG